MDEKRLLELLLWDALAEALPRDEAEEAGRAILRENALVLYRLA